MEHFPGNLDDCMCRCSSVQASGETGASALTPRGRYAVKDMKQKEESSFCEQKEAKKL
jgi:hypothetical protein